jgi:hypothetical protein
LSIGGVASARPRLHCSARALLRTAGDRSNAEQCWLTAPWAYRTVRRALQDARCVTGMPPRQCRKRKNEQTNADSLPLLCRETTTPPPAAAAAAGGAGAEPRAGRKRARAPTGGGKASSKASGKASGKASSSKPPKKRAAAAAESPPPPPAEGGHLEKRLHGNVKYQISTIPGSVRQAAKHAAISRLLKVLGLPQYTLKGGGRSVADEEILTAGLYAVMTEHLRSTENQTATKILQLYADTSDALSDAWTLHEYEENTKLTANALLDLVALPVWLAKTRETGAATTFSVLRSHGCAGGGANRLDSKKLGDRYESLIVEGGFAPLYGGAVLCTGTDARKEGVRHLEKLFEDDVAMWCGVVLACFH